MSAAGGELPEVVQKALAVNAAAREAFWALPPSHRAEYLRWVGEAKKAATRAARAERMVRMLLEKSG
ncbi:YdeI/OmpD-associated family protein [Oceanithermus sp.]